MVAWCIPRGSSRVDCRHVCPCSRLFDVGCSEISGSSPHFGFPLPKRRGIHDRRHCKGLNWRLALKVKAISSYEVKRYSIAASNEGCPILRQIYAWHCIVFTSHNNTVQKHNNKEWSKTIRNLKMLCINLSEYWTSMPQISPIFSYHRNSWINFFVLYQPNVSNV